MYYNLSQFAAAFFGIHASLLLFCCLNLQSLFVLLVISSKNYTSRAIFTKFSRSFLVGFALAPA